MITVDGKTRCAFDGCEQVATSVACGRLPYSELETGDFHPDPAGYCETHKDVVADEGSPEHTASCPNCGCEFGVN